MSFPTMLAMLYKEFHENATFQRRMLCFLCGGNFRTSWPISVNRQMLARFWLAATAKADSIFKYESQKQIWQRCTKMMKLINSEIFAQFNPKCLHGQLFWESMDFDVRGLYGKVLMPDTRWSQGSVNFWKNTKSKRGAKISKIEFSSEWHFWFFFANFWKNGKNLTVLRSLEIYWLVAWNRNQGQSDRTITLRFFKWMHWLFSKLRQFQLSPRKRFSRFLSVFFDKNWFLIRENHLKKNYTSNKKKLQDHTQA